MSKVYLFADFKLDCKNWVLYRSDEVISLAPKLIDTLIYLIEHAGKVVSHEDLLSGVWLDTVVTRGALNRNISIIRTALSDEYPYKIIQTVKNRGYIFSVPVTAQANGDIAAQSGVDVAHTYHANGAETARTPITISDSKHADAPKLIRILTFSLVVVAIALLMFTFAIQPKLHKALFVAKQITTNSEAIPIAAAAISPSGNKLAFADGTGLFVADIQGIERHPVSLPDGLKPTYIQWLPDEFHLLITGTNSASAATSLWKTSIAGGEPTLLLENVSLATPSPDGQQVLFIRNSNELWITSNDGANARLLTKTNTNSVFLPGSRILPDGQSVIISTYNQLTHSSTIASILISNGMQKILHVSKYYISDFLLLNDKELLIAQQLDTKKMETELAMVDSGQQISATADNATRRVAYWQGYGSYSLTASYNNKIIALVNSKLFSGDYVADLQDGGNSITNVRRIIHPSDQSYPVEWLADNATLLYMSNDNGQLSILSQRIDSADIHILISDQHDNRRPAVTADQRWLFYFSYDANQVTTNPPVRLMKQSLADGVATLVDTRNDIQWKMRCAKTINFCVVAENAGNTTAFVVFDPDKGRGNELYRISWNSSATAYDWDLSADGTHIGYLDLNSSPAEIHIVQLNQLPITSTVVTFNGIDQLRSLRWDAEATGFFAASSNSNGDRLSLLHLYTNGSVKVLQRELNGDDSYLIGSPDGKYLAFNKWLQHNNIWLLQRQ